MPLPPPPRGFNHRGTDAKNIDPFTAAPGLRAMLGYT
ncbi:MAG: hypothetical protein RLZZ58_756 [Pseudomonadota bacterium]|jgi:hypothetical protein